MEKKNRGGKDVSTCGHKLTRNTWPFFEVRKIRTLARVSHMNVWGRGGGSQATLSTRRYYGISVEKYRRD